MTTDNDGPLAFLAELEGQEIPGGCELCDAYQTIRSRNHVHIFTVHHADGCPDWMRMQARRVKT